MTYPMSYARWIPSLTQDLMLWLGSHPASTYASFIYYLRPSISMERNSVGGKHVGEGCFLHALLPRAEHCVTFVPSGAQGGLAVIFSLSQEVLSDPPKEVRA